jgi:prophage antirepressor-like protein
MLRLNWQTSWNKNDLTGIALPIRSDKVKLDGITMSENMLTTLRFEGKSIRMVGTADQPEWVAADVCELLGIRNPSESMRKFPANSKGISSTDTPSGMQEMLTVTEKGLYRLIFKSRKPEAQRFSDFVCDEVLPCIRKHGCYPAPDVEIAGNAVVTVNREFMSEMGMVLREAVFGAVAPLNEKVDDLDKRMSGVEQAVNDLAPRKPLSVDTKKLHIAIVYLLYNGKCPCCAKALIVGEDKKPLPRLQFDHWVRRTQNGPQETWAVCGECNSRFNDHDFKASNQVLFAAYQKHRESFQRAIAGPCFPGMEDAR